MKITPIILSSLLLWASVCTAETVFITLEKDNAIAVVDPISGKLIKTVKIGQRPRGIQLSPDQQTLYIATSDDDTVLEVDANSLQIKAKLPSGEDPETFAINSLGTHMYVSNEDDNQITVIDLLKKQAIHQVAEIGRAHV